MKEEIIKNIKFEIKWCKDSKPVSDYEQGFIKGLEQALLLVKSTPSRD